MTLSVDEASRGRGCGARLYAALTALLRAQGFRRAVRRHLPAQRRQRGVHVACGFTHAGTVHAAGYKFDRFRRRVLRAALLPLDRPARDPLALDALDPATVAAALSAT